jgi:hypothetical protein
MAASASATGWATGSVAALDFVSGVVGGFSLGRSCPGLWAKLVADARRKTKKTGRSTNYLNLILIGG